MKDLDDIINTVNTGNTKISISNNSSSDIIFHEDDNNIMFSAYKEGEKELHLAYNKANSFLRLSGKAAQKFEKFLDNKEIHPVIYKEFSDRINMFKGRADKYDLNKPHGNHEDIGHIDVQALSEDVLARIQKGRDLSIISTSRSLRRSN